MTQMKVEHEPYASRPRRNTRAVTLVVKARCNVRFWELAVSSELTVLAAEQTSEPRAGVTFTRLRIACRETPSGGAMQRDVRTQPHSSSRRFSTRR